MNFLRPHTISNGKHAIEIAILKILCSAVFLGRAWEHLRWDPPFRSLLWDQELMEPFVKMISGLTWMEYATSPVLDRIIQNMIFGIGCFYLLCAIASLIISKKNVWVYRTCQTILMVGIIGLVFLAFLYCKEKFFHIGQFFEYTSQFGSVILLLIALAQVQSKYFFTFSIKVVIALTFFCHGLYAVGYYPVPGIWADMFIVSLDISEKLAYQLLFLAGVLDLIFSIAIFIPFLLRPSLIYLFIWGFMTSMARLYANFYSEDVWQSIEQYLHEVIYRIPHFGLPLLLLIIIRQANISSSKFNLPNILRTRGDIRLSRSK